MAGIEQGGLSLSSATTITVILAPGTIVGNGVTTVTTAGTRVVLGASTTIKSVTVRALKTNTGLIYVGSATVAAANGFQLSPQETVSIDIDNLTKVNIDSSVNGDGVSFIYLA